MSIEQFAEYLVSNIAKEADLVKVKKFETEEGCLSLSGVRPTTRYKNITVKYLDMNFKEHTEKFNGWTAQIIQHEVDHCDGIVI